MKRCVVSIFVLILALSMATFASAQMNKLAYFDIDADIATDGFQGGKVITGIDGGDRVGFAVYVKNTDQLRGYTVTFTWDGAKAENTGDSGPAIDLDRDINGEEISRTEDNALGDVAGLGEIDEAGKYEITYSKLGGDALASTDFGLLYCLVLKAAADFTTGDSIEVKASISAINDAGEIKSLGTRSFYVNEGVDVKTSSWGEIKSQFKD